MRGFVALLRRRFPLIRNTMAVGAGLALAYIFLAPPEFTATARIIIDARGQKVLNIEDVLPALGSELATIESQVEILRSRRISERVLLARKASAVPAPAAGGAREAATPDAVDEKAVGDFMRMLRVERKGLSYIIDVSFAHGEPIEAARIANAVADAYLADQLETKFSAIRAASQWLKERVADVSGQVRAAEERVQHYRAQHGLVAIGEIELSQRQVADHALQVAIARSKAAEAKARLQQVELLAGSPDQLTAISKAIESTVIIDLRRQRTEVQRKLGNLVSRYGEQHHTVVDARAELETLTRDTDQEISRLVKNARNDFEFTSMQVKLLDQDLEALKKEHAERTLIGIGLAELARDAEATRQLYASLLKRFKETQAQETLQIADARIVAYAAPPLSPSSPRKTLTLALALIGSLMIGIVAALLRESFASEASRLEDVERHTGLPAITILPTMAAPNGQWADRAHRHVAGQLAESNYAQAIFQLHLWMQRLRAERPSTVVLVASALPGEGKSTTAIMIAEYAARHGFRTLLIDADLHTRSLTAQLAPNATSSLVEIATEEAAPSDVIVSAGGRAFDFCPAGRADERPPATVMASPKVAAFLDHARREYEFIIVDTSALLPCADARSLFGEADGALVVRGSMTSYEDVRCAIALARVPATCQLGIVLNAAGPAPNSALGESELDPRRGVGGGASLGRIITARWAGIKRMGASAWSRLKVDSRLSAMRARRPASAKNRW